MHYVCTVKSSIGALCRAIGGRTGLVNLKVLGLSDELQWPGGLETSALKPAVALEF